MATINYLTRIEFDHGVSAKAPEIVRSLKLSRILLVTDPGLYGSALYRRFADQLGGLVQSVFHDTPQNPDEAAVEQAAQRYLVARCDGIVALGGGSSIDLAKGAAIRATHEGPLESYAAIHGGVARISSKVAPVIAVPTTAGTGSEVGRATLITLRTGEKLGLISPYLIPRVAICDPELTLSLPAGLTAATGMDALTHCLETFVSPLVNPPAEAIALDGLARAARWIRTAVSDGGNIEARWQMMMAALQGGLTFQKGLGAVHAMSHPLGALAGVKLHHGTLNAVILPVVYDYNLDATPPWKQASIRHALGLDANASVSDWIRQLNRDLNLPASLSDMGVTLAMVDGLVQGALQDHSNASNPKPLAEHDYRALFASLIDG